MKRILIIASILLVAAAGIFYLRNPIGVKVQIGTNIFYVDVAITSAEKELGLGYRESMKTDHGMLFVYDHPEQYRYWMKNMRFPIDILWIKDNTIVDITKNVPVESYQTFTMYTPKVSVNKVLELNANASDTYHINVGDTVRIRF
jgi:uncharacterized membrane protein (UPF0127 family)